MRLILLIFLLMLGACTKDFETINTDETTPNEVRSELLLRQVIYSVGDEMSYEGFVAGNLLCQHFTMVDFNLFDRHELSSPQLGGNPWPTLYAAMRDNERVLQRSMVSPIDEVYRAPAMIMKAYLAMTLTDIYGDVPYSEAIAGVEGQIRPAYDSQESIYMDEGGIIDLLARAVEEIDAYEGIQSTVGGDILFGGDLMAWRRMARSLEIKALVRVSGLMNISQRLQDLYNEGGYILVNADNAAFDFTDGQPNSFRMEQLRSGDFELFLMSATMQAIIEGLEDPRREVFFRPIGGGSGASYASLPNGPDASETTISISDHSLPGRIFREETGRLDANFITAWEVDLLLAEAAGTGLIFANTEVLYRSGVTKAFDYWGAEMPTDYLESGPAAFGANGVDIVEQIITQKWIANSINGYENWIEWRRTGFPVLQPVTASLNAGMIPLRMPYPADEQALNAANASAAVPGNSINVPVWWDVD